MPAFGVLLLPVSMRAAAGDLFEADGGSGAINKFTPGGTKTVFASGLNGPAGLAFDGSGNLFASEISTGTIYKFTRTGTKTTFASGLSGPGGLAFDAASNLFEGDSTGGTITKITPAGTKTNFASGLNGPGELAFDSAGNLFEADRNSGSINKFTSGGTKTLFASGLSKPTGLAVDSSNNLFEAEKDTGLINKFTSLGAKSNFASGLSAAAGLAVQPADLLNISTRMEVLTGNSALIAGFIIKEVLLRALGPTLAQFGVAGALADPTIELHNGAGTIIATNDNWKDSQQAAIAATGLAPPNDLESAILITLVPGNYSVVVRGKNNSTGVGLVDVYDRNQAVNASLTNISTRGFVDTGVNVMIGGVISSTGSVKMLVRALGPTLSQFGVPNVLADPTLELHDAHGALIASNDNWQDTQKAAIQASGLAPPNASEAAIIITKPAGNGTAIVRGKNNTTGNALVEFYRLPP
jgi:hypothetical protein